MWKIKIFIVIILCDITAYCQENPIKDATYHFTIQNEVFIGNGADTLKKYIQNAQFFLLGEEHNMKELQDFTISVIPFLKTSGYDNLALEIGPIAARKLHSLYLNKQGLIDFNSKYFKHVQGAPFGFFNGKEEERFSNKAFEEGFNIWGIDFENYNSSLFILDELFDQSKKSTELDDLYKKCQQVIVDSYKKDKADNTHILATTLINSEPIKAFFKKVNTGPKIAEIIRQQVLSWEIYEQESKNNWYPRVANMKENFAANYKKLLTKRTQPKVFVKLGAVHIARGTSSSGFQELGNMVYELSNFNGTKTFSVISFARYRINSKGEILDLLEKDDAELLEFTSNDSWSVIDLARLKKEMEQGKIKLSIEMISYAQKFDMMLIPPATKYMEPNFNVSDK
ncbi:hypothetical protein [Pedobacter duraquae]|uniref:Erythromycin esterase n=1 Tax=Pedobacter duraquae TaxID=425511 RepID=A0A4R6INY1_9SPHI|nr:hypothetical protein [Pedobacter duraquae]TDO23831.1 hypothetical protein CLV32_0116 [Pedobacter duraquae]